MGDDIKYSEQALVMIKNLSSFDKTEFEKWYFESLVIGSNSVLQFLLDKEIIAKIPKGKIILP